MKGGDQMSYLSELLAPLMAGSRTTPYSAADADGSCTRIGSPLHNARQLMCGAARSCALWFSCAYLMLLAAPIGKCMITVPPLF
jgi:hypothetical protein